MYASALFHWNVLIGFHHYGRYYIRDQHLVFVATISTIDRKVTVGIKTPFTFGDPWEPNQSFLISLNGKVVRFRCLAKCKRWLWLAFTLFSRYSFVINWRSTDPWWCFQNWLSKRRLGVGRLPKSKCAWFLNPKSILIWKLYYTITRKTIPMKQSVSVIYLLRVALWLFSGWIISHKEWNYSWK